MACVGTNTKARRLKKLKTDTISTKVRTTKKHKKEDSVWDPSENDVAISVGFCNDKRVSLQNCVRLHAQNERVFF